MITEYFGDFLPYRKFYITDETDLEQIPKCLHGSEALDTTTKELWVLQSDNKWHKFGTEESKDSSWSKK